MGFRSGKGLAMTKRSEINEPQTAHLTDDQMRSYQGHKLTHDERALVQTHLAGCGSCRRALLARVGPVAIPAEAAALREPLHLEYDELTAYLDGKLSAVDRERAEDHLFLCASCARELDGMRRLDVQLAVTVAEHRTAPEPKVSIGERISRFFAVPGRTREFGMAFGAVLVGAFLIYGSGGNAEGSVYGARGAARLIDLSGQSHAGIHIGGFVLMAVGVGFLVYSVSKKK